MKILFCILATVFLFCVPAVSHGEKSFRQLVDEDIAKDPNSPWHGPWVSVSDCDCGCSHTQPLGRVDHRVSDDLERGFDSFEHHQADDSARDDMYRQREQDRANEYRRERDQTLTDIDNERFQIQQNARHGRY